MRTPSRLILSVSPSMMETGVTRQTGHLTVVLEWRPEPVNSSDSLSMPQTLPTEQSAVRFIRCAQQTPCRSSRDDGFRRENFGGRDPGVGERFYDGRMGRRCMHDGAEASGPDAGGPPGGRPWTAGCG